MAAKAKIAKAWGLLKEQALSGKGGHSALLDLASRMAGLQHWHEAHERGKAAQGQAARGRLDGEPALVRVQLVSQGPRLGGAKGQGLRANFAALRLKSPQNSADALAALALSSPAPPSWSQRAWRDRAMGLARLLPEASEAMAALGEPSSVAFLGSWEGISRARTLFDKTERESLGSRWIDWARPWHSVFAPVDAESRQSYEPMARAWARAQEMMDRAERADRDWLSQAREGKLSVDPGDGGAWLGLAQALLRSEGLRGELANWQELSEQDRAMALRHFPPA